MRIQLWSYNYDPEPTGIAPLSTVVARELRDRGNDVEVVAAHPHYPQPRWGTRVRPYRERRDGIRVTRLPIWPGRRNGVERIRQEATFTAALAAVAPLLDRPDAIVAVSPSFPGLAPAIASSRARRVPWVLWLQDILPDGAMVTGVIEDGPLIAAARRFERLAYNSAGRIVVISDSFRDNLLAKGVDDRKIIRAYNPASMPILERERDPALIDETAVLNMGNVGHTQNLAAIARAFERDPELERLGATLTLAGDGVAADDVRAAITGDRVLITGVLDRPELGSLLERAALGLVSQSYEGIDFNVPSKLMNFMGRGLPVIAAVRPESEVARLVERSGCGWVTTSPSEAAAVAARALQQPDERAAHGRAGLEFAREHFAPARVAERIEQAVLEARG
jgi:colanic acid biosynthesis glycosyl transferase WcaI